MAIISSVGFLVEQLQQDGAARHETWTPLKRRHFRITDLVTFAHERPWALDAGSIVALQQTAGNSAVANLLASTIAVNTVNRAMDAAGGSTDFGSQTSKSQTLKSEVNSGATRVAEVSIQRCGAKACNCTQEEKKKPFSINSPDNAAALSEPASNVQSSSAPYPLSGERMAGGHSTLSKLSHLTFPRDGSPKDGKGGRGECDNRCGNRALGELGSTDCELDSNGLPTKKVKIEVRDENPCTKPCVEAHERNHAQRMKSVCEEVDRCLKRSGKDDVAQERCLDRYERTLTTEVLDSECTAYKAGQACLRKRRSTRECSTGSGKERWKQHMDMSKCYESCFCKRT